MHLYDIPLIFVLAGLVFYAVLGGADFGAGFWQLTAGKGPHAQSIRDHAHHAIAPVWEAKQRRGGTRPLPGAARHRFLDFASLFIFTSQRVPVNLIFLSFVCYALP